MLTQTVSGVEIWEK